MEPRPKSSTDALFVEALSSLEPCAALATLARRWKAEGMQQSEMYSLFEERLKEEQNSNDERSYNALADTMDLLVGWCAPGAAIFRNGSEV